jgi:hypothetical protein
MAVYNTSSDAANTAIRAFLTEIGSYYLNRSFNTGSGQGQQDWIKIKDHVFGGKCAYCGCGDSKLQMEHLIMFNREEYGLHHPGNIVPVCTSCNKRSKAEGKKSNTWESHLLFICESKNEKEQFQERLNKIKKHINDGEFKYPVLSAEENNALRIITNNLYESIKNEFVQAVKLFEDLTDAYTRKAVDIDDH